jgi:predicted DNA-binding transcriptional regulator AlpA
MQLISKAEAARRIGDYHPASIMRLVRAGKFPQPVRLNAARNARIRFVAHEIDAWLQARLDARAAPADA